MSPPIFPTRSLTENPNASSSEDEAGQQMLNISLFTTSPDVVYSFPAAEIREQRDLYPRWGHTTAEIEKFDIFYIYSCVNKKNESIFNMKSQNYALCLKGVWLI